MLKCLVQYYMQYEWQSVNVRYTEYEKHRYPIILFIKKKLNALFAFQNYQVLQYFMLKYFHFQTGSCTKSFYNLFETFYFKVIIFSPHFIQYFMARNISIQIRNKIINILFSRIDYFIKYCLTPLSCIRFGYFSLNKNKLHKIKFKKLLVQHFSLYCSYFVKLENTQLTILVSAKN